MPKFLEITDDKNKNYHELLVHMVPGTKYTFMELADKTGKSRFTIKNLITGLRESINFEFMGKIHHLAKHQISKISYAYILREGEYGNDDYYFKE